jgi:hypothetical protein
MEIAAKLLIVGGVLNLAYSFLTGFLLANTRRRSPAASKYLIFAHVGPLMQGPMLLSLVFAVTLSPQPALVKTLAASLMVAESGLLAAKDTLNWVQGVMDEFVERPPGGIVLGAISVLLGVVGLLIFMVGIFQGL